MLHVYCAYNCNKHRLGNGVVPLLGLNLFANKSIKIEKPAFMEPCIKKNTFNKQNDAANFT